MALIASDNTPRATEAQKEYIENLLEKTGADFDDMVCEELAREVGSINNLTVEEASVIIDALLEY